MELMDRLSGVLLLGVVALILFFLVKEIFWKRTTGLIAKYAADDAKPVNTHLIGTTGTVIEPGRGESSDVMKVRIGMERWNAQLAADRSQLLPVGTEIKVLAVSGPMLEVEEHPGESIARDNEETDLAGV